MSTSTTYLITGANRGIGLGLVANYLARPVAIVIAGVRDPTSASIKSLTDLPRDSSSTLIIVKIDSLSETDPSAAVKFLEAEHNISHLDVVIANAGIGKSYSTFAQVPVADVREHVNVNGIGTLILFQAVCPLLKKSKGPGKFITISSPLGSIGAMEMSPFSMGAYGISKTMLNYMTRKIHFETEDIIALALHPGFVQTDMGNAGAVFFGMAEASTSVKDSVAGIVVQIDKATRETTSGHFLGPEGEEIPW